MVVDGHDAAPLLVGADDVGVGAPALAQEVRVGGRALAAVGGGGGEVRGLVGGTGEDGRAVDVADFQLLKN